MERQLGIAAEMPASTTANGNSIGSPIGNPIPVGYVPTLTENYRSHRKSAQMLAEPGMPRVGAPLPIPIPPRPLFFSSRVLIWKQDPSVAEIGTRKAYLPGMVLEGSRDARVTHGVPGIVPVSPNAFGDFIQTPGTDQFDAVHTFAVVRETLAMYQRALAIGNNPAPLPWQWNSSSNSEALKVFPHDLPDTMNAFYSRN